MRAPRLAQGRLSRASPRFSHQDCKNLMSPNSPQGMRAPRLSQGMRAPKFSLGFLRGFQEIKNLRRGCAHLGCRKTIPQKPFAKLFRKTFCAKTGGGGRTPSWRRPEKNIVLAEFRPPSGTEFGDTNVVPSSSRPEKTSSWRTEFLITKNQTSSRPRPGRRKLRPENFVLVPSGE